MKKLCSVLLVLILAVMCLPAVADGTEMNGVQAGDVVTFGQYPQTEEGEDQTPIEWIVLDVQNGKALLLSRCALDAKPYNDEETEITWETSTIRSWLNGEFLSAAFTAEEQSYILLTYVDNSEEQGDPYKKTDGGNNTKDLVFLLSFQEAYHYLVEPGNDTGLLAPLTAYAVSRGAFVEKDGGGNAYWWMRSPGREQTFALLVGSDGVDHSNKVSITYGAVRPALWISTESGS